MDRDRQTILRKGRQIMAGDLNLKQSWFADFSAELEA
jgi:hypothetical protein